ncbi:MAG TPA: hypothetical protein VHP58_04985 [Alphaproteobacteria bacterium]|nr:hypothetical protein [Alphaproteobacteria bacterium]
MTLQDQACDPLFSPVELSEHIYDRNDAVDARIARADMLTLAEVRALPSDALREMLYVAIEYFATDSMTSKRHMIALLADPRVTPQFVNRRNEVDMNGRPKRASLLNSAMQLVVKDAGEALRKLGMVNQLLDKGAADVNHCRHFDGMTGPTTLAAACDGRLWKGLDEISHCELVARLMKLGGDPMYQRQPHQLSAHETARQFTRYLLALVPDPNEGQLSFQFPSTKRGSYRSELALT